MAPDDIRPFLASLKPANLPPAVKSASLTYRFELEDGRTWDLLLQDGRLSVAEGKAEPDVVIRCAPDEWARVLSGRVNLLTAWMRGDVGMRGDLPAAKALYTFSRYARVAEAKA